MKVQLIAKRKQGNNVIKNLGEIWHLKGAQQKVQAFKNGPGLLLVLANDEEVKQNRFKWQGMWIKLNDPDFDIVLHKG